MLLCVGDLAVRRGSQSRVVELMCLSSFIRLASRRELRPDWLEDWEQLVKDVWIQKVAVKLSGRSLLVIPPWGIHSTVRSAFDDTIYNTVAAVGMRSY